MQGRVSIATQRLCPVKTMRIQMHEGQELIPLMNSSPLHSSIVSLQINSSNYGNSRAYCQRTNDN